LRVPHVAFASPSNFLPVGHPAGTRRYAIRTRRSGARVHPHGGRCATAKPGSGSGGSSGSRNSGASAEKNIQNSWTGRERRWSRFDRRRV